LSKFNNYPGPSSSIYQELHFSFFQDEKAGQDGSWKAHSLLLRRMPVWEVARWNPERHPSIQAEEWGCALHGNIKKKTKAKKSIEIKTFETFKV